MNQLEVFRLLLRAYPRRTREAYGDDMAQLFADQLRHAPPGLATFCVWARIIWDTARNAPREHLAPQLSARVVEGPRAPVEPSRIWAWVFAVPSMIVALMALSNVTSLRDDQRSILFLPWPLLAFLAWAVLAGGTTVLLVRATSIGTRLLAGIALNVLLVLYVFSPALTMFALDALR